MKGELKMEYEFIFNLQGGDNFRDLGGNLTNNGVKVKNKKLIRASHLNKLTDQDITVLMEYGMGKIIDLRGLKEKNASPDKEIPLIENIHIAIFDDMRIPVLDNGFFKELFPKIKLLEEVLLQHRERMLQVYSNFVTDETSIKACKKIFQILLNNEDNGAILFHCTAGKDRTGFVSALILATLGVQYDMIMKDYMLTNQYLSNKVEHTIKKLDAIGVNSKIIHKARGFFMAQEEYLDKSFCTITEKYGSLDIFLSDKLDLTVKERVKLNETYLM